MNQRFNHVMVDLETLGTRPYSGIVSLGAVMFDAEGLGAEGYFEASQAYNRHHGLLECPDTMAWWGKQGAKARAVLDSEGTLESMLKGFVDFIDEHTNQNDVRVWGNSSCFDNVILRCAYEVVGITVPWHYSKDRCYRTMYNLAEDFVPFDREGTHPNALDDAKTQARHLVKIMDTLDLPLR